MPLDTVCTVEAVLRTWRSRVRRGRSPGSDAFIHGNAERLVPR